jgi:hypothetical protein
MEDDVISKVRMIVMNNSKSNEDEKKRNAALSNTIEGKKWLTKHLHLLLKSFKKM